MKYRLLEGLRHHGNAIWEELHLSPGDSVFELGPGHGFLAIRAALNGASVVMLEHPKSHYLQFLRPNIERFREAIANANGKMLHAHAYEPLVPSAEFIEAVPADLQRVILRCLEKDPDRRYPDAATLEKALAACEGIGEWTPERAEEWWRRHGDGSALPSAPEAGERVQQTMPAGF